MSHSYGNLLIHAIWSTKDWLPLIDFDLEKPLIENMKEQFAEKGCRLYILNGMPDHVHCLFNLNLSLSVAEVIKHVKGNSSHFVNQHNLIEGKFSWQTGYAAFSVSESGHKKVFDYILNQKTIHKKRNSKQELQAFLRKHGLDGEANAI
jgi:REP element-mobilizing transposase RayT